MDHTKTVQEGVSLLARLGNIDRFVLGAAHQGIRIAVQINTAKVILKFVVQIILILGRPTMKYAFVVSFLATITIVEHTQAAPVKYRFSGTVTSVADELASEFTAGEALDGYLRIESIPFKISSTKAIYSISEFVTVIGGDYTVTASNGSFQILNNFGGSTDRVHVTAVDFVASQVADNEPDYYRFDLRYDVDDLSNTNLLPQFILPTVSGHSGLRFEVNDSLSVRFNLHDFSVVPEPNSYVLALVGLSFVGRRVRRAY